MVVLGPASLKDRGATATFSQPGGPSGPQPGFQEGSLVQLVAHLSGRDLRVLHSFSEGQRPSRVGVTASEQMAWRPLGPAGVPRL